jgi:ferritin-like metal-binding protein YciE
MRIEPLRELFLAELQDLHSAEQQITKSLPRLIKASHDPNLRRAFEHHLEESKLHITRLEQIFKRMSESPKGKNCDAMTALLKEAEERVSDGGEAEILDAGLISAMQRVEHYEIAAYGSARTYAWQLNNQEVARFLNETLEEEKHTDAKLSQLARRVNIEPKAA